MIPELGHFALALACALALAQTVLPLWGAHRNDARLMAAAPAIAIGQMLALATSFACLVLASVDDDFSVLNVAQNSHTLKPLLYKVTGAWGNHEGSILLWTLILAGCGGAVALFGRGLPSARSRPNGSSAGLSVTGSIIPLIAMRATPLARSIARACTTNDACSSRLATADPVRWLETALSTGGALVSATSTSRRCSTRMGMSHI